MEIIKVQKTSRIGRKIQKTIIKTNCDFCEKEFEFLDGVAHFERSTEHFCSGSCLSKMNNVKRGNKLHGLSKRENGKQGKVYSIWCAAKKRAKMKGRVFSLEVEDIPKIPEYCPILNIKIIANTTHAPLDSSPSLDRIDSDKGYVKGNVQIISNRANRIKADATIEEIELILNFMKGIK